MKGAIMATTGRPRKFEEQVAVDAAMLVFWRRGYQGASIDELCENMQIKPPSLYAAFGDKRRLFIRTIDRYLNVQGAAPSAALNAPFIADALRAFFKAVIRNNTGAKTPHGCLVANVLVTAATEAPEFGDKLRECIAKTDAMIEIRLRQAIDEGEISANCDVATMARLANSMRHGLSIRARAGIPRRELFATVDSAVLMVLSIA
jgi:AcrR family transcriptional regulator